MLSQSSTMKAFILAVLAILPCDTLAFVPSMPTTTARTGMATRMSMHHDSDNSRGAVRSRIEHFVAVAVASSVVAFGASCGPALAEELPPGTNPFTSICMGFGCGEFQGLDYPGAPAPTDEESITFKAFLNSLDKGLVAKVDFLSGGNKAYAFLKPSGGGEGEPTRIRIGEGYPDEQGDGWSSPLWVVRALGDRNVPYHFEYNLGKGRARQTVNH